MLIYSATIDSREYFLASSDDAERLKVQVLEAIQAGGRFVDARSSSSRHTSVLVTSSTPVAFDIHEATDTAEMGNPVRDSFSDFEGP
jgi:hypothetical protein